MWYFHKNKAVNLDKIDLIQRTENSFSTGRYEIQLTCYSSKDRPVIFFFDTETQRDKEFDVILSILKIEK